jgi:hypothetical protein
MPRPLSGLVRISVEEGRVSNRFAGGCSTGGEELLLLDADEEGTWDLASFTCLLARISAKDILFTVDRTAPYLGAWRNHPGISRYTSHSALTNSENKLPTSQARLDIAVLQYVSVSTIAPFLCLFYRLTHGRQVHFLTIGRVPFSYHLLFLLCPPTSTTSSCRVNMLPQVSCT